MTVANTGSSSFTTDTKDAFSYFSPQLKMLWPSSVQKKASPRAIHRSFAVIAPRFVPDPVQMQSAAAHAAI